MAQKSIVDRALMLAAGICAAALVWQLTVLLTTKSKPTPSASSIVAQNAAPEPVEPAQPPASAPVPAPATPPVSAIRVVYAGTEPATKTSLKASDPPVDPIEAPASPPAVAAGEPPLQPAGVGASDQANAAPVASEAAPSPHPAQVPDAGEADETASTLPPLNATSAFASAEPPVPGATDRPSAAAAPTVGALDLNHASAEALNHLRGAGHIGQAIVSHRPYRSVEDLVKKRVLRRGVYEQIKQQVVAQ